MMYQGHESSEGLLDQDEMDQYCYFVAGVVGEMLTHIFCDYCPELLIKKITSSNFRSLLGKAYR